MKKQIVHSLEDIARLANVSRSTVSRALNNSELISKETTERIQAIARENNFRINVPARNLRLQQSQTIAFVVPNYYPEFSSMEDLFGLEVLSATGRGLHELGYDLLTIYSNPDDITWAQAYLDSGRVDGFIIMASNQRQAHLKALVEMDAPFIAWGVPVSEFKYCSVTGDNVMGGRLATQHFIDNGREHIAFLGGPEKELTVQNRFMGYKDCLAANGHSLNPNLVFYGDYSHTSGISGMRQLLEQSTDIDAVFVNSDLMAVGAIKVIQDAGKRVPEDIAVIGYDDTPIALYNNLPLTTIRQNFKLIGQLLAKNLIQYIQAGIITNVVTPVELVIRQTA